jgi:hypothetical protein
MRHVDLHGGIVATLLICGALLMEHTSPPGAKMRACTPTESKLPKIIWLE